MSDLFADQRPDLEEVYPGVFLLANFFDSRRLMQLVSQVCEQAPLRKMMTPMGHYTGIPLTNCGDLGWTSDIHGYRYSPVDPETKRPWPVIPNAFMQIASRASQRAGYLALSPDACLINQYPVGGSLGSHQDKNEKDFCFPIVSLSIGLPAVFQIYGAERSGKAVNCQLLDGDVMVWGGQSRLIYHGVRTVKADPQQPATKYRYNITLRKAG